MAYRLLEKSWLKSSREVSVGPLVRTVGPFVDVEDQTM